MAGRYLLEDGSGLLLEDGSSILIEQAPHYWHSGYWKPYYWKQGYWGGAEASVPAGAYWSTGYWHATYWKTGYWAEVVGSGNSLGAIDSTLANFTSVFTGIQSEIFDISVTVGPTWTATEYGAFNGTIAVTLEDATSLSLGTFTAEDAILGTIATSLAASPAAFTGTNLAPGSRTGTIATTLQDAAGVFNAQLPAAIDGLLPLVLEDITGQIRGNFYDASVTVADLHVTLESGTAYFPGTFTLVPVEIDIGPRNPNAILIPSNYEICDRTGFRVLPGELVKEWTGLKVRRQSWESRHPQDFVRARTEHPKGSQRPEQPDQFLTEEVTADDL